MLVEVHLSADATAILDKLERAPATMLRAIRRTMFEQNEYTIAHTRATRLIGKGPYPVEQHRLGQVNSKLWQSLTQTKPQIVGDQVISSIGSPLRYGWAHEFGFQGTVTVPGHMRKNPRGRTRTNPDTGKITRGRRRTGTHMVWGHSRRMNIPARAPIWHGLRDRLHDYERAISQAVVQSWKEKEP